MRNAGADLFRCFMMLLIVLHHAIVHTRFSSFVALKPFFVLSNIGVIGFLVVSGWYGVGLSGRKVFSIAGQIIWYGLFFSLLSLPLSKWNVISSPMLSVGNAWYGVAYLALLSVSPVLNAGIETLCNQGKGKVTLFAICALLFIDWLSRGIGLGFSVNGFGSHTFGTFICVYCIVRFIRLEYGADVFARRTWEIILITCGVCGMAVIRQDWFSYNNLVLVVLTIMIFLRFLEMNVCPALYSVIRFIVPSVFAIYLIHDVHIVGKTLMIVLPFEWVHGHASRWILFPAMILFVYLLSIALDLCVRRLPLKVFRCISRRTRSQSKTMANTSF